MVTVNEAKQKIIANTEVLTSMSMKPSESLNYVLFQDVRASISLPSFRQSSMDGYAVHDSDITARGTVLEILAEAKAGEGTMQVLPPGAAMRIFTGAPVPEGATAVIMQERTTRTGSFVTIEDFPVTPGRNIRSIGQQIMKGSIALPQNILLTAGAIGFLSGLNVEEVSVYRKPKIGLLVTGDELVQNGSSIRHGQVYESNSLMLRAALQQEGVTDVEVLYAKDDLRATIDALDELAGRNDIVLASGGISVGDYDFVGEALQSIRAETIFYKVRQKPGKPLLFARRKQTLFFALPGNPASSLVCYYEYVLPAIRKMSGRSDYFLRSVSMPIERGYSFDGERDEFLKATANQDVVIPLDGQESFALRSFAIANAIIYLTVNQNKVEAGDHVEVHLLPA
ncbi:gephyrin-like molybdotransferase Glp [Dyadobacter sp. CY312]|uniref:molybdopterin molybdotransferase MoeA n=1 Tax=Dyadobacter sp. CY312 TaxID=2907303 RepID=UPI001F421BDC|nr:gephyrin-like molybdotransferase Glp [Dyadobacter sp. CY312]MCE7041304.1 molybdopterin molybdotransferase MoeA [Dyadobacter sp. CY312]